MPPDGTLERPLAHSATSTTPALERQLFGSSPGLDPLLPPDDLLLPPDGILERSPIDNLDTNARTHARTSTLARTAPPAPLPPSKGRPSTISTRTRRAWAAGPDLLLPPDVLARPPIDNRDTSETGMGAVGPDLLLPPDGVPQRRLRPLHQRARVAAWKKCVRVCVARARVAVRGNWCV